MLKTNDLRIGNLVDYECTTHKITMIFKQSVKSYWIGAKEHFISNCYSCSIFDIKPIELTEKNILDFDFCKDNSENNKTYLSPMFDGNVIKIYFNRFGVAKFQLNMHFQIELQYVHQLQNLYHLLSGGRELVFSNNA